MYTFWYAVFCSRCSAAFSWNGPCDWSISPESIYLSNCEGTLEFRCSLCFCMFSRLCSNSSSCFEFEQTGNTARKIFCDRRAQLSQNCLLEITLCTLFTPVTIETPRRHALEEKKEKSNCINISSFSHCTWKMKPRQMCQKTAEALWDWLQKGVRSHRLLWSNVQFYNTKSMFRAWYKTAVASMDSFLLCNNKLKKNHHWMKGNEKIIILNLIIKVTDA